MFKSIRKRDGERARFKTEKITDAIAKASAATGEFGSDIARKLTMKVLSLAEQVIGNRIPAVEEVLLSSIYCMPYFTVTPTFSVCPGLLGQ